MSSVSQYVGTGTSEGVRSRSPSPPHPTPPQLLLLLLSRFSWGAAESEDTVESLHLPGGAFAPSWAPRVCSVDWPGADLSPAGSAPTLSLRSPRLGSEILFFPAELRSLGEELGGRGGWCASPCSQPAACTALNKYFLTYVIGAKC